jgi:flavin-dependent dehydrogenase
MLLARQGMKVLAIDRGEYGTDTISTHALMRGGVLQLHRWDVLPRIMAAGTPAVRATEFHYGQHTVKVALRAFGGVDALYAPRRTVLDSALVDAAMDAGAEIRHGHVMTELLHRPNGRVAGVAMIDRHGKRHEIVADLVVGADGAGSRFARLAGAPMSREATHASALIYGHWHGIESTGYHWYYEQGVSAGVIPTNADRHCVFACIPSKRFGDELRHDLVSGYHRVLAKCAPTLEHAVTASRLESRLWAFAGRKGFMRQACGPGWALVGDAGYFKDPLTAHGITDALRDAELLAHAVAGGSDARFMDYAKSRDELSIPLFQITDAIASFAWDLDSVRRHHETLNAAMKREVAHLSALSVPGIPSPIPDSETSLQQEKAA